MDFENAYDGFSLFHVFWIEGFGFFGIKRGEAWTSSQPGHLHQRADADLAQRREHRQRPDPVLDVDRHHPADPGPGRRTADQEGRQHRHCGASCPSGDASPCSARPRSNRSRSTSVRRPPDFPGGRLRACRLAIRNGTAATWARSSGGWMTSASAPSASMSSAAASSEPIRTQASTQPSRPAAAGCSGGSGCRPAGPAAPRGGGRAGTGGPVPAGPWRRRPGRCRGGGGGREIAAESLDQLEAARAAADRIDRDPGRAEGLDIAQDRCAGETSSSPASCPGAHPAAGLEQAQQPDQPAGSHGPRIIPIMTEDVMYRLR